VILSYFLLIKEITNEEINYGFFALVLAVSTSQGYFLYPNSLEAIWLQPRVKFSPRNSWEIAEQSVVLGIDSGATIRYNSL